MSITVFLLGMKCLKVLNNVKLDQREAAVYFGQSRDSPQQENAFAIAKEERDELSKRRQREDRNIGLKGLHPVKTLKYYSTDVESSSKVPR